MAITCRTPHLRMQSQAEHSERPKPEEFTQCPALSERPSSIYSPHWIFSPTLLQSGDCSFLQGDWGIKVGFGKMLAEAPWSLRRAIWEDSQAQAWQLGMVTGHCLCPQRGKGLPQPPNWAFCPWTHCDLGMGCPAGRGSHSLPGACTEQPGDPQLDWSTGSIPEEHPSVQEGHAAAEALSQPIGKHRAGEGTSEHG